MPVAAVDHGSTAFRNKGFSEVNALHQPKSRTDERHAARRCQHRHADTEPSPNQRSHQGFVVQHTEGVLVYKYNKIVKTTMKTKIAGDEIYVKHADGTLNEDDPNRLQAPYKDGQVV